MISYRNPIDLHMYCLWIPLAVPGALDGANDFITREAIFGNGELYTKGVVIRPWRRLVFGALGMVFDGLGMVF